ncbi:CRISPR-associated protein Cas4 [Streptomyces hoynatensis]|uniref:CRISPR-associated exonuclease Cas4 n=2 Tax=Streptomyces hoynatensis TaxID=1141874 RepID=A0A3A9YTE7_9ACTN|nr:CRISPR-associated protein Cas4 [Streptomyces hoynatensis]
MGDLPQVPLSALEHFAYCPRQAALILLEATWSDDAATVRGTLAHQRVDTPGSQSRAGTRTLHALPVWHDGLGLFGICDAVELHRDGVVLPIEHKSGRYRPGGPADLQAAAQAICLAEMFQRPVPHAAIYSGSDKRRHTIPVTDDLRQRVTDVTTAIRTMLTRQHMPPPAADKRCRRCSLATDCMPHALANTHRYRKALAALYDAPDPDPDGNPSDD